MSQLNLTSLREMINRRNDQAEEIRNTAAIEDEPDVEGAIYQQLLEDDWLSMINFTHEEFDQLFHLIQEVETGVPHRGPRPKIPLDDAIILLLILYRAAPTLHTLAKMAGVKETALSTAINTARRVINETFKKKWWNDRMRPIYKADALFPFLGLLVDVNSIPIQKPGGTFAESKIWWDQKNGYYAAKFEVAVSAHAPHYALFVQPMTCGATHDFEIFKSNAPKYVSYLQKTVNERRIIVGDNAEPSWAILGDKAYIGPVPSAPTLRKIHIKKNLKTSQERKDNVRLAAARVHIESFFGRVWKAWSIFRRPYPFDRETIQVDYENCILLTNELILLQNLLSEEDREYYLSVKAFIQEENELKKQKRKESNKRSRNNKKLRIH